MTPTAPAISATFWPRAEAASTTSGAEPPGHQHLPADPVHLGRLDRRPGRRGARGAAGHHDGQLGVEWARSSSTTTRPATRARTASASARSRDRPHALAVVAAPGRLEHRPASRGTAANAATASDASRPAVHHHVGRHGTPAPSRTVRMWALSTASSSVVGAGPDDGALRPPARPRSRGRPARGRTSRRRSARRRPAGRPRRRATRARPRRRRRRRRRRGARPARPWRGRARWPPRPPYAPAGRPRRTRRRAVLSSLAPVRGFA